jgi:hypothetical protein
MTLANGAGFSKPGEHLLQLMIPTKGQASYEHLSDALKYKQSDEDVTAIVTGLTKDVTSITQSSKMDPDFFDLAMRFTSDGMSRETYHRDPIESVLCEGRYGRITMERFEVYVKGVSLHIMSVHGGPMFKRYGTYTWIPIQMWTRSFRFVEVNVEKDRPIL